MAKTIADFTDKELADMVRNSIYAKTSRFGYEPPESRFLLVLAVSYSNDEVEDVPEAIEAFARLLRDDDYNERDFQIYDHHRRREQFFSATLEEVTQ